MLLRIYSIGLIFSIFMFLIQPGICTGKSLAPGINDTVSYPGGETALHDFLFSHNLFNSSQAENSIEGIVGCGSP